MNLQLFFEQHPQVAVAFSGGVDSAYLLYAAKRYAQQVCAYYVQSAFQPDFELRDARRLAQQLEVPMRILPLQILDVAHVRENPADRCYYCKTAIFSHIRTAAQQDGFTVLLDGTNDSDEVDDRPGMRALGELSVLSPLRECGLGKEQIRALSKEAGLFTWDKPAYACLATRIPTGEEITQDKLTATQEAENDLFSLGFTNFRVRARDFDARIQLPEEQIPLLMRHRKEILEKLKRYYRTVSLDLEVRR